MGASMRPWIALAAIVLFLPQAVAAPLDARLEVQGVTRFIGQGHGEAAWIGSLQDHRLGHDFDGLSGLVDGGMSVLSYSYAIVKTDEGSPPGYGFWDVPIREDEEAIGRVAGAFSVDSPGPSFSVRVLPAPGTLVSFSGPLSLTPQGSLHEELFYDWDAQPYQAGKSMYPPAGAAALAGSFGFANQLFPARLVLTDVVLQSGGRTYDARWETTPASIPGMGTVEVLTTRVIVVEGHITPTLALDDGSWHHSVAAISGKFKGDLFFSNARGTGSLNGTPLPDGIHNFQAQGTFNASSIYTGTQGSWTLEGDSSFVAANASPLAGARGAWAIGAGSAIGVGVLVAFWLSQLGRELASFILGRNFAEPLSNATRIEILRQISDSPGMTRMELVGVVGASRATVRYHLRALEGAGLVEDVGGGKIPVYVPNHGATRFEATSARGARSGLEAKAWYSEQTHPVRRWILQAAQSRWKSYRGLVQEADEAGIAPRPTLPQLRYHCRCLLEAGLLEKRRGREVTWRAVHDARSIDDEYRRRLAILGGERGE